MDNYTIEIIEKLRTRLRVPLPGRNAQEKMIGRVLPIPLVVPGHAVLSAVLCLLVPIADELNVILMKRMDDHTAHAGQVSFPGGRFEDADNGLQQTALREAHEEIGALPQLVDVLGALSPVYIPVSNYNVFPFVGYLKERPDYHLNRTEVSYTMEVPLKDLWHPDRKTRQDVFSPAIKKIIPDVNAYMLHDGTVIWGATAMMLSELETIMQEL